MKMQVRFARHTDRLMEVVGFYRDGLGLPEIGRFANHDGYDGVFLAVPGTDAHLEFTSGGHGTAPSPHREAADLEGHDGDVRGDAVGLEVGRVDAAVVVGVGDDRGGVVVDPVLVLVGRDRDPQHRVDVLAEAGGADDPGVPDLVRRLVGEAGQVEEVGEVLRVPGSDRGARE